ncbi:DUF5642 family protein [Mycobacterium sp.]|jgi:hypothetical protein|uniref:DUF5642 family protein n=1 Tax=Mycobacterium sp. TaxID=1785 RepID=UPI002C74DF6E|nr:DUF5642 family protein [Mycobacterium sp.]HXB84821.1 DUF5642 family protein [Mycobacterium sp.]
MRIAVAIGSACLLAGCSSHGSSETAPSADITKISQVKSDFGPEFKVKDVPKTAIDPKVLSTHKLPPGLKFDPPDCSSFVVGEDMPPGLQGNMAAVAAEGDGNRFIAMAVQTSEAVPVNDPGRKCQKVGFEGGRVRGLIEVVKAPQIQGTRTLGVHRVLQTTVNGKPRSGELYNYTAHFGDYQVIITANPVPQPGKSATPIDTNRARDLLVKSVAAIRS